MVGGIGKGKKKARPQHPTPKMFKTSIHTNVPNSLE